MDQVTKAKAFADLHVKGSPLVLWNVWDAGSAKAVADAGAPALATGSWSVAAAQGFADGEALPMEDALRTAAQIVASTDLPVTVDFEACYAGSAEEAGANAARLIETGAVGLNYEDRIVAGGGLLSSEEQASRIAKVRQAADAVGVPFFINARSDVFFSGSEDSEETLFADLMGRAAAYAKAGANGLFVPGLADLDLIARVCDASPLPVNIMRMSTRLEIAELAKAGVARISHGPGPYNSAMKAIRTAATAFYS